MAEVPRVNNVVVNNTVVQGPSGRWALNIRDASTGNIALNNIFYNAHSLARQHQLRRRQPAGVREQLQRRDGPIFDGRWRHVLDVGPVAGGDRPRREFDHCDARRTVCRSVASDNYLLKADSPAIDRGTATQAPPSDLAGTARPSGNDGRHWRLRASGRNARHSPGRHDLPARKRGSDVCEVYTSDPATSSPMLRWPMSSASPLRIETLGGNDQLIVQLPVGPTGPVGGVVYPAGDGLNTLVDRERHDYD